MKRLFALALALCLIFTLSACGQKPAAPASDTSSSSAPAAAPAEDNPYAEHVKLVMCFLSDGNNSDELKRIQDAINEILVAKFNTEVQLVEIGLGDYTEKMNLMLSTGEQVDLLQGFFAYDTYVANGYYQPLDNYIDNILAPAVEILGDYSTMGYSGGHYWGLTPLADKASGEGYVFIKEYLDACGVDYNNICGYEELGNLLYALKAVKPEIAPISGPLSPLFVYGDKGSMLDKLGSEDLLGVLLDPVNSTKVSNLYEDERFTKTCEYAYQWAKDGLIIYEGGTDHMGLVRGGLAMGTQYVWTPKAAAEASSTSGFEMAFVNPSKCPAISTTGNYFTWSISASCEYPERAALVLNEFYVNKELSNIFAWGIEGTDYEIVDENLGSGVIKYPDGKDSATIGYFQFCKFGFPNNFNQYVMEGTDPYQWQTMDEFNRSSDVSKAMGFSFDVTNVSDEIAACSNVVSEYSYPLLTGQLDPAIYIPEFQQKLVEAGINDIIAEKQAQLDAWVAANS